MPLGSTGRLYRRVPGRFRAVGFHNKATLTNQGITYTAKNKGTGGNSISITIAAGGPLNRALSVSVTGNAITVTPATGGTGAITSTQAQVRDAVNANTAASALVEATGGGATLITALAATNLSGGTAYVVGASR